MTSDQLSYLGGAGAALFLLVAANRARNFAWQAAVLAALTAGALFWVLVVITDAVDAISGGSPAPIGGSALEAVGLILALWCLWQGWRGFARRRREGAAPLPPDPAPAPVASPGGRGTVWGNLAGNLRTGDPASMVLLLTLVFWAIVATRLVALQVGQDLLGQMAANPPAPVNWVDILVDEVPYLVAAVFGVGWLSRRDLPGTMRRLGLEAPRSWAQGLTWLGAALATVLLFLAAAVAFSALIDRATPQTGQQVAHVTDALFHNIRSLQSIAVLSLASGICEELYFRGALQPRLGIIATAAIFASVHIQYGFTLVTLQVFVLGMVLGLVRRRFSTTTSITTHVAYNFAISLLGN
ncbi:MAG: CPBP family intramembrane glutamic endopeptidase [Candidatus Dormibacteria bacterium]